MLENIFINIFYLKCNEGINLNIGGDKGVNWTAPWTDGEDTNGDGIIDDTTKKVCTPHVINDVKDGTYVPNQPCLKVKNPTMSPLKPKDLIEDERESVDNNNLETYDVSQSQRDEKNKGEINLESEEVVDESKNNDELEDESKNSDELEQTVNELEVQNDDSTTEPNELEK